MKEKLNSRVPKSFKLFGNTWKVLFDNEYANSHEVYGAEYYGKNTIILSTSQKYDLLSDDRIASTFYHELVHAILDEMKESDLSKNEQFVNIFGNLLYQFISSRVY